VLALAKVMIDSLNEREIEKYLPDKRPDEKGISKFDRFLETLGLADYKPYIVFMRNLWDYGTVLVIGKEMLIREQLPTSK
jgi:hypothetical protein